MPDLSVLYLLTPRPLSSTLFPYTTLFRSQMGVIDVASTSLQDTLSTFSNYGAPPVWLPAPGEAIMTRLQQSRAGSLTRPWRVRRPASAAHRVRAACPLVCGPNTTLTVLIS